MSTKQISPLILLVDDDAPVRQVCRIILQRAGFSVVEADSAHAAKTIWDHHATAISLLVTDHDMPGANGLQLSALLRLARPELKVLLISGGALQSIPSSIAFLQKPFSPSDLAEAVRQCLCG